MLQQPTPPLSQATLGLRPIRPPPAAKFAASGKGSNPFLKAHYGMIPKGPILFLGSGNYGEALQMAQSGRSVTVFEEASTRLAALAKAAAVADAGLKLAPQPVDDWRLGYQRWAGIIVLSCPWPTPQRRRLFAQIPNALKPGGVFLMETEAAGPLDAMGLHDHRLDPDDVRPELEVLFLPRFVTLSHPGATGARMGAASVLQVVGIHLEPNGLDDEP